MLKQSHIFRENQQVAERVMDSNALERERGITIMAKNTAIVYRGTTLEPLFEAILEEIPAPDVDPDGPTQLLVTMTTLDDYKGKIVLGRLQSGRARRGQTIVRIDHDGTVLSPSKVTGVFTFSG